MLFLQCCVFDITIKNVIYLCYIIYVIYLVLVLQCKLFEFLGKLSPTASNHNDQSSHNDQSLIIGLLVPGVIVVMALLTVLVIFIIRHRRLQNSFTTFANSHFDNRRGTTTFGTNDLGEFD